MQNKVPFFSLERQYKKTKSKIQEVVQKVLDSQQYIGGPFVQDFENKFKDYVKVNHAISCNSGTDALWLALKALDVQKNDIVLTTPFTFIASSSEIAAHEAHPVFIDVDEKTYNIDPQKIALWLSENAIQNGKTTVHKKTGFPITGILTVNIFGRCADYKAIKEIAKEWNLWIIEDAAQSIGATDEDGKTSGTFGDIACFSFYPTKNLGAFGDGGCCTTNNEYLAERLIQLRNHGRKSHYNYTMQGINSRLDAIQAAVLSEKLNSLDELNASRREIAKTYKEKLSNLDFLKLPQEVNGKHVYHQYCMQVTGILRDQFSKYLNDAGIATNIYYPKSLDQMEFLNKDARLKNECPVSKKLTANILALPIWPELTKEEINYVCEVISNMQQQNVLPKIEKQVQI